jgi:hypothetical protein
MILVWTDHPYLRVGHHKHPSEMRIIINNEKTIFVTGNAYLCNGTKQVHV